jgi:hypothetical protein
MLKILAKAIMRKKNRKQSDTIMKVLVSGESKDCLDMSHVSVINWVKREALKVENHAEKVKKPHKVKVLEIDEMCVNFKKTFGFVRQ